MDVTFAQSYRNARWNLYERFLEAARTHPTASKFAGALAMAALTAACAQIEIHTPITPVPFTFQVFAVLCSGALLGRTWGAASQEFYVAGGILGLPVFAGGARGLGVLTQGLTGGYLIGFILAAWIVGWYVEGRSMRQHRRLLVSTLLALATLVGFAVLDAYLLAANPPFATLGWGLVLAGELSIVALIAYAAIRRPFQQERVELFAIMTLALLIIYLLGALWFAFVTQATGLASGPVETLELTVVPFLPWDLAKIALAVTVLTALRPTRREIAYRAALEAVRV